MLCFGTAILTTTQESKPLALRAAELEFSGSFLLPEIREHCCSNPNQTEPTCLLLYLPSSDIVAPSRIAGGCCSVPADATPKQSQGLPSATAPTSTIKHKENVVARVYVGEDGDGCKLFYSTDDGDPNPDREQTVYRESNSIFGGSTEIESTYNPSEGRFNND